MDDTKILSSVNGMAERSRRTARPPEAEDDYYGPDLLRATGFGRCVQDIREDALEQARSLYGPDAALEIQEVGMISTTMQERNLPRGPFYSAVEVRCLNFVELGL